MYTSYYNLRQKPFEITSDPKFLWFGEKHKEALATLRYGILNNKGFLVLTGDVGTGKTTLINALLESLPGDVICSSVPDPNLELVDFLNFVASSFGIKKDFQTKGSFLIYFKKFLLKAHQSNKKALLIIDEAQLLTDEMLEQIRLLSNIDRAETKLLNIFFVGQNEFNILLMKDKNRAVRQRISLNYNIEALNHEETLEYINFRFKTAGGDTELFTKEAVKKIHLHSGGYPRRINIICDHSLLSGYVKDVKQISGKIVQECTGELRLPTEKTKNSINLKKSSETHSSGGNRFFWGLTASFLLMIVFLTITIGYLLYQDQGNYLKKIKALIGDEFRGSSEGEILNSEKMRKSSEKEKDLIKGDLKIEDPQKDSDKSEGDAVLPVEIVSESILIDKNDGKIKEEPLEEPPPFENKKVVLRFLYNSNDFSDGELKKIEDISIVLNTYPESMAIIRGYTDSTGYSKYNKKLSEFRANLIKSFLIGKGIEPARIEALGFGHENPIEDNNTAKGRMMNRRVEVEIYQKDHLE